MAELKLMESKISDVSPLVQTKRTNLILPFLLVVLVAAITFLAYGRTLFNFFSGDDYLHVEWLKRAVHDPELIWRNFHGTWLDDRCSLYYRPLISVFMVQDYLLWGENGLGFRITNIFFLLASSAFLFLIISDLPVSGNDTKASMRRWGFVAATFFALYPLHPEAVAWITGRVDTVVAAFYLGSLWCYIRWRQSLSPIWYFGTFLNMALALMSKEMGISLPLAFLCYEVAFFKCRENRGDFKAVASTNLALWCVLGFYFGLRLLVLGSLVGGWDSNASLNAEVPRLLGVWKDGLIKMILPFNFDAFKSRGVLKAIWISFVSLSAAAGVFSLIVTKKRLRPALFFALLFGACMLPVYKVFTVSPDLESSRYAYLGTVPLCALLLCWFGPKFSDVFSAATGGSRLRDVLAYLGVCSLLLTSFAVLRVNCEPWRAAGIEANALKSGLRQIALKNTGRRPLVILQWPDIYQGAYVGRNALMGMTADYKPHLWLPPATPFGLLRGEMKEHKNAVLVYSWNKSKLIFEPVNSNIEDSRAASVSFSGVELRKVLDAVQWGGASTEWQKDGALAVDSQSTNAVLHLNLSKIPAGTINFIALDLKTQTPEIDLTRADLHFSNECCANGDVQAGWALVNGQKMLVFPLHGVYEFVFGQKLTALDLAFPVGSKTTLRAIHLIAPENIMPILTTSEKNLLKTDGVLRIHRGGSPYTVKVDGSKIAGASSLELELTKPNYMFVQPNYPATNPVIIQLTQTFDGNQQEIELAREMFDTPGFYQLRMKAQNAKGESIGVPSDHLLLMVE